MYPYLQEAQSYGFLSVFAHVWAMAAVNAGIFIYFVDYGIINLLMDLEEASSPPQKYRAKWRTFVYNDTLLLPPFVGVCAYIMHRAPHPDPSQWYIQSSWQLMTLIFFFMLSVGQEVSSLIKKESTWSQQLSPPKLFHTIIFGPMGSLMLTGLVAAVANASWRMKPVPVVLFMGWAYVTFVYEGKWLGDRKKPQNSESFWSWRKLRAMGWPDD